ncbi:MAG: hypothetical protein K6F39_01200 [Lachnospiraceae bacterium]|nr:hypothetical protein [Lachnospiraceae bacterium]
MFIFLMSAHDVRAEISEKQTKLDAHSIRPNNTIIGVHISAEIESIASNTFVNQINLRFIEVEDDNPNFSAFSNCLYDKEQTILYCFPQALIFAEIPSTVTSMDRRALKGVNEDVAAQVRTAIKNNCEKAGVEFQYTDPPGEYGPQVTYWPYTNIYPLTDNDLN